jgi:hypothetical protein
MKTTRIRGFRLAAYLAAPVAALLLLSTLEGADDKPKLQAKLRWRRSRLPQRHRDGARRRRRPLSVGSRASSQQVFPQALLR